MYRSSTSSSDWKESQRAEHAPADRRGAWRFAARVSLFALPLLLVWGGLEAALWRTAESWPADQVLAAQAAAGGESLYGRGFFSQQFNLYKRGAIAARKPEILVVGSSRVMQFRAQMFPGHSFYNGGGLLQNLGDLVALARILREERLPRPKVMIVGIDPWWMSFGASTRSWLDDRNEAAHQFSGHVNALRALLRDRQFPWRAALTGTARTSPVFGYRAFGVQALEVGAGERGSDGSHLYTASILEYLEKPVYRDRESPPMIDRVPTGRVPFTPSDGLDPGLVTSALLALRELSAMGIETQVYLPPVSSALAAALSASPRHGRWWREYREEFPRALRQAGFVVTGPARPVDDGLDDRYMFDGVHPSEVMVARAVAGMVRAAQPGGVLGALDAAALEALAARAELPLAFERPKVAAPLPSR
jgi:hypothetical protein